MNGNKTLAVAALQLVAAKATILGEKLEHSQLWEGEYREGIREIRLALAEAERNTPPGV